MPGSVPTNGDARLTAISATSWVICTGVSISDAGMTVHMLEQSELGIGVL